MSPTAQFLVRWPGTSLHLAGHVRATWKQFGRGLAAWLRKNNELKEFNKISLKFSETFTPNYKKLHNLGKNFFLIDRKNINYKFMTLTSFIG